jgi:hypothetical protein
LNSFVYFVKIKLQDFGDFLYCFVHSCYGIAQAAGTSPTITLQMNSIVQLVTNIEALLCLQSRSLLASTNSVLSVDRLSVRVAFILVSASEYTCVHACMCVCVCARAHARQFHRQN